MKEYKWHETIWHYAKRGLRAVVPQIPAFMAQAEMLFPKDWVPVLVLVGGCLTALDKFFRDKGLYSKN